MNFWRGDFGRIIDFDKSLIKKVFEEGTDRRELARFGVFVARKSFVAETVVGEIA